MGLMMRNGKITLSMKGLLKKVSSKVKMVFLLTPNSIGNIKAVESKINIMEVEK